MKFWDSSALVPLLIHESGTKRSYELIEQDSGCVVWWASPLECASAIARLERSHELSLEEAESSFAMLKTLQSSWHEIHPNERIRERAQRLLRLHPLRTSDSLQLAAASLAQDQIGSALEFICFDQRLLTAARKEGMVAHGL